MFAQGMRVLLGKLCSQVSDVCSGNDGRVLSGDMGSGLVICAVSYWCALTSYMCTLRSSGLLSEVIYVLWLWYVLWLTLIVKLWATPG
jgi:hypothetical protein